MPDLGCGAHNQGHFERESCSCKKKQQPKYTSVPRFHPDKGYKHKKGKRFQKKAYFKKRSEPADKEKCFICGKKGHWANKCPNKNKKPRLASMFSEDLDPSWWDLAWCAAGDYPEGEVVFLPEEGDSSDSDPALDKFAPNSSDSSSSDSDEEADLGGCSGPPYFSFYMFSLNLPKVSSEFRIAEIDKELSETPVYQYMKKQDLKDEKRNLLTRRKAKEKEQSVSL